MEPINTHANNSKFQQVTDEQLEKAVQDFNEFQERVLLSSSSGEMKLEELIDMYINTGRDNSYSTPQATQCRVTEPLDSFNKFESMLHPHQVQPAHVQFVHGLNIERENQESEIMIQHMNEDTSQNETGNFPNSSQTVNINSHVGAASSSKVTYVRYGDLNCHEAASSFIGSVFGRSGETVFSSVMRFFRTPGAGAMNFWPQVRVKENAHQSTRRKRARGIIESEEETTRGMEKTKLKNRDAAAKHI